MNVVDVNNTVNKCLMDLRNKYGDNIEYIEVYDGNIVVYYKSEYVKEKIAEALTHDFIKSILNAIWGNDNV